MIILVSPGVSVGLEGACAVLATAGVAALRPVLPELGKEWGPLRSEGPDSTSSSRAAEGGSLLWTLFSLPMI